MKKKKLKINPGDTCIFDPYNVLCQKVGYNNVTCVKIINVEKHLFAKNTVDFFDIESGKMFENVPESLVYKVDNFDDPQMVIKRLAPEVPLITEEDLKFINYCYLKLENEDAKKYAKFFYKKLKLYQLSELFTRGEE